MQQLQSQDLPSDLISPVQEALAAIVELDDETLSRVVGGVAAYGPGTGWY